MKPKTDDESKKKLKDIQKKLADKMADDMFRIVKEEASKVDAEAGGFNSVHLWKLKSKLRPKLTTRLPCLTPMETWQQQKRKYKMTQ